MNIIVIFIAVLICILFICRENYEKFTLNFPKKNQLKCKCGMNSNVEGFANYDKSTKKYPNQLDRIYNIYKAVNDVSAEKYYENKYSYPISPELKSDEKFKAFNNVKYQDIGLSSNNILPDTYENDLVSSYEYSLGIKYEV